MANPPSEENMIMEEREEIMVSPTGSDPTLRVAHFLRPSVTSIDGSLFHLPPNSLCSDSKKPPLKVVTFNGWRHPQKKWKAWVDRMHSVHQSLWKTAGIHDAVLNSTHTIRRNDTLVLGFAERWCSETNSFVFPWGEASITLEDMMVLGGFSVLGDPVSSPLETSREVEIQQKLIQARIDITRSKAHKATQSSWVAKFMDSGNEMEHEAFLALWLSRFVFPRSSYDTLGKHVFPISVSLARGRKMALAPAVLADLYRELSFLKSGTSVCEGDDIPVPTVWAPWQFVQIWAWERFPTLRPNPNSVENGEPRWARWHNVKKVDIENVRLEIDSASEYFHWRPYAMMAANNSSSLNFYRENEEWVSVESGFNEELESLARCFRVSELVGVDCLEQYLPHRVAMQFGMDQDLPGHVARANMTPETAWTDYTRPVGDAKFYFPSRLFESDISTRYLKCWKQSMFAGNERKKSVGKEKSSSKRLKFSRVEVGDSVDEDNQTLAEILRNAQTRNGKPSKDTTQLQTPLSSNADNETVQKAQSLEKATGDASESRAGNGVHNMVSINSNKGECSTIHTHELPVLELEAQICKLEKVFAQVKAAKARDSSKNRYITDEISKIGKGNISAQIFTFMELCIVTNNFNPDSLIGEGGFGRVYRGHIQSKNIDVAVKQLDRNGFQGNREFFVEVLMLSLLHHPNLVNLVGYCADGDQRVLVYEYMPQGSLEDHLFDIGHKKPLDWNTRMKIAEGAARGLEHLHEKANPPVIYRDFKASNILLDESFNPKLSDFGLAKLGPTGDKSHVSTRVMGTYGYCAPEYALIGQLATKSDVYSFGVVFLELITGRRVIDNARKNEEQNLITWAQPLFKDKRMFHLMADPLLEGKYPIKGLYQALAIAAMCLQEEASTRPLISDVVTALEFLSVGNSDEDGAKETVKLPPPERNIAEDIEKNEPNGVWGRD